jgi:hypothetical protein
MRLLLFIAIALLGFSGLAMARPHSCDKQAKAKMAELGVAAAQIRKISFIDIRGDSRANQFLGYEAWVGLEQCQGNVVMIMSLECAVRDTHTRGACKFEGLKSSR